MKSMLRLSNNQLRLKYGIPTIVSDLRCRRLKWLRGIVQHSGDHHSLMATLTGALNFGMRAEVDSMGRLCKGANPRLKQFYADLAALAERDDEFALAFGISGWFAICTDLFMKVPLEKTWTFVGPEKKKLVSHDVVCDFTDRYCGVCGHVSKNAGGLQFHKFQKHGCRHPHSHYAICNQCPPCLTILGSTARVLTHVTLSLRRGSCEHAQPRYRAINPLSFLTTEIVAPPILLCHNCNYIAENLEDYYAHLNHGGSPADCRVLHE